MAYTNWDWKPAFLAALREVPVLRHGCDVTGVERTTVLKARRADPDFDRAVEEAMEAGVDKAEQEAFRRAVVGFEEPVIHQGVLAYRTAPVVDEEGKPVVDENGVQRFALVRDERGQPAPLTVRKHSDSLLSLVLKGRRKKVYADRTELTGAEGGAVQVDATTRAARVAAIVEAARKRRDETPPIDIDDIV